jgi:predicted DCC family thiol-disulfide oxidoreductase YuxK
MKPRHVVVYDGECSFCRAQVARVRRLDKRDAFEYAARQTPGLVDRFPALASGDFDSGMRLISPGGETFVGADAVHRIARQLPYWRRVAWLYEVPGLRGLARKVYRWVAAHRRSLRPRCESGACEV